MLWFYAFGPSINYKEPTFFHISMRVQLWTNHKGYNLGAIGNILGNNLRTSSSLGEHDENTLVTRRKTKIPLFHPLPSRRKTGPFTLAA
jgi:hypothetical protein